MMPQHFFYLLAIGHGFTGQNIVDGTNHCEMIPAANEHDHNFACKTVVGQFEFLKVPNLNCGENKENSAAGN